jgi:hypothetical protein
VSSSEPGSSSRKRTRGPNQSTPWARRPQSELSVLRLALDIHDPVQRRRVEAMFSGAYQLRRALQRAARDKAQAYWAATHERENDPAAVRDRLGLSRTAFEHAAYVHLDAAPHLRRFVTKALAMHLADTVWSATERHLFRDARGHRHGASHVGRWFAFARLPGRARSHTTARKWETFRVHGTLAGHRAAYRDTTGDFVQPRRLRPVTSDAWWTYDGPLAIVFSGLAEGALVLPMRLPTAPSNQPLLDHHLADPSRWHKVDLVRTRDPSAPGDWRYEAHLMVLTVPYASPATVERRGTVAIDAADRIVGIDVNVSNLTIASHDAASAMRLGRIERDTPQRQRAHRRARAERRRQRALDRSRRAMNRAQYQLSKRQQKRAQRRTAAGLAPVDVIPAGPRNARTDGVPLQRYRHDQLSRGYHRQRAAQVAEAAAAAQARRDHARQIAADVIRTHGYQIFVEDGSIAAWSRSWGRAIAAFTPGLLVAAIDREARAVAEIAGSRVRGVRRVATRTTAMSQHCPCGTRVPKTLADRAHVCPACGLCADRDAVAAVLASFVVTPEDESSSAVVDYDATCTALAQIRQLLHRSDPYQGWQGTPSESTDLSAREGFFLAWSTSTPDSVAVARRIVGMAAGPILNEPGICQTTSERARWRTGTSPRNGPTWLVSLRDDP